ncbi:Mitochondrial K+-H+ exchange-related [Dillenia turbinata]|uniref:Mitochondrial K+-H+ exchange-related n=1 Tax=Dillenia turbinata TaxID=194707 RepID=A0AAN8UFL3_9MAGN
MKARLVVFPIRGRKWCFSRSGVGGALEADTSQLSQTPSTLKDLWNTLASNAQPFAANAELLVDFVTNKMNKAWVVLEKAPHGTLKNKIHGYFKCPTGAPAAKTCCYEQFNAIN